MNAYYEHNDISVRNSGTATFPTSHAGDKLISAICAIVALFTCSAAIKIEKTILSAICFVGFFGAVGSIENGTVSAFAGILICAAATLVEALIFKSLFSKKRK